MAERTLSLARGPRARRWRWIAGGALAVAAFALGAIVGLVAHRGHEVSTAPPIQGLTAGGVRFTLTSTSGHWVLLNFFASWCTECRTELPALADLQRTSPHRLEIISVDTDDSMRAAARMVRAAGGSWTIVNDPNAIAAYGVTALPESFLIDPTGHVVGRISGAVHASNIEHRV